MKKAPLVSIIGVGLFVLLTATGYPASNVSKSSVYECPPGNFVSIPINESVSPESECSPAGGILVCGSDGNKYFSPRHESELRVERCKAGVKNANPLLWAGAEPLPAVSSQREARGDPRHQKEQPWFQTVFEAAKVITNMGEYFGG